jgi:hypothetical protein
LIPRKRLSRGQLRLEGWRCKVPGILWNVDEEREGVESTGLYRGVLQEDMIDTVHRVQRPFIDVFMEDLFFEDADYPLTYVPMVNMVLPLRKGQEVWVYFNQQNHRYPVLWKLADKMGNGTDFIEEKFEPALSGVVVAMPEVESTKTVYKVSDSMWVITTDSYCVMHYGDSCVLMNSGGVFANAEAANMVVDKFNVDVLSKLTAKVKQLDLALGTVASQISLEHSLTIDAVANVLKFTQSAFEFAGGTFKCGVATPGAPGVGPFLNSAAQNCFYCGAAQGSTSFSVPSA